MVKRSSLGLLVVSLLLSGCSMIPTNIVNELNMLQGVGYDLAGKKIIKGTFTYPAYKKDKTSTTVVKTSLGETSKEIRININSESRYPVVSGQLRLALYGKSLAKKGIYDMVDTLNRDPSIGSLVQVAIVDGDSNALFKIGKFKTENVSLYVQEMLDQIMKSGNLPRTDLQSFLFQLNQIGQDPYLPLIKQEKDNIKISGIAILRDDQLVTTLPFEDLFIFKCLVDKYKYGLHQFILENGEKLVLDNLNSKANYQVKTVNGNPEFTINIKVNSRLLEFTSPKKKRVPIDKKKIQNQVDKQLEKNALKIIHQFKDNDVDPIGLGAIYKEHYRGFNEKHWKTVYPSAKVHVNVQVAIEQSGIID
ncbi:Ger(x)C family spore germination protein [Neobacillus ginsengisoli]|uniref:Spore germination protein n=1 Tax=Neobacillus ginsengisoli TaxID=904295 RepID=A0ABT9Y0K6_9BACI|nr:Ger(x)C family spore germination protein [Neobacillus ginsengisoli]MDQ0201365.1 spore germination protein [Neobacillus ginsengisoli]